MTSIFILLFHILTVTLCTPNITSLHYGRRLHQLEQERYCSASWTRTSIALCRHYETPPQHEHAQEIQRYDSEILAMPTI